MNDRKQLSRPALYILIGLGTAFMLGALLLLVPRARTAMLRLLPPPARTPEEVLAAAIRDYKEHEEPKRIRGSYFYTMTYRLDPTMRARAMQQEVLSVLGKPDLYYNGKAGETAWAYLYNRDGNRDWAVLAVFGNGRLKYMAYTQTSELVRSGEWASSETTTDATQPSPQSVPSQ